MSNDIYYGEILLAARVLFHFITAASILSWHSDHRTKPFTSLLAFLIAGSSIAAAFQGLLRFHSTAPNVEFPLVVLCGGFAFVTVVNGGNVGSMLNSTKQRIKNWMPKHSPKR